MGHAGVVVGGGDGVPMAFIIRLAGVDNALGHPLPAKFFRFLAVRRRASEFKPIVDGSGLTVDTDTRNGSVGLKGAADRADTWNVVPCHGAMPCHGARHVPDTILRRLRSRRDAGAPRHPAVFSVPLRDPSRRRGPAGPGPFWALIRRSRYIVAKSHPFLNKGESYAQPSTHSWVSHRGMFSFRRLAR